MKLFPVGVQVGGTAGRKLGEMAAAQLLSTKTPTGTEHRFVKIVVNQSEVTR